MNGFPIWQLRCREWIVPMSGVRRYRRKSMLDLDKESTMEYGKLGNTDIEGNTC